LNYAEAAKWYRRAAEQGDAEGQRNLGVMYGNGKGVPQDYIEAYKWSNLAAAQGNTGANRNRNYIVDFMLPEQVAEAQRRSTAFVIRQETPGSYTGNSNSSENSTVVGTGFFITDDGYLISNYHVVKYAAKIRLITCTGTIDAKVVGGRGQ
jgi:TPR repeat protein